MILTKQDLKKYIEEDCLANVGKRKINPIIYIIGLLCRKENYLVVRYLKALRKRELHTNNNSLYNRIARLYYRFKQNRLGFKYGLLIHPNITGYGLTIRHLQGGVIINCKSMGNYCRVNGGVVVGNKDSQDNISTIGNNVRLSIGSKVIGKVTIGDNAIVAPNSVVIKDVLENTIVSGVPAQIVKRLL